MRLFLHRNARSKSPLAIVSFTTADHPDAAHDRYDVPETEWACGMELETAEVKSGSTGDRPTHFRAFP